MKINGSPDLCPISVQVHIKNSDTLVIVCSKHITFKKLLLYICEKTKLNSYSQICTVRLVNGSTARIKPDCVVSLADSGIETGSIVELYDTHHAVLPEINEPIIQYVVPVMDQAKIDLYNSSYKKSLTIEEQVTSYLPISQIEKLLIAKLQMK